MVFVFDGIYSLEVTYDYDSYVDEEVAPIFTLTNDNGHEMVITYWSTHRGGHQRWFENYKNGQKHGIQYGWYAIQEGGNHFFIANYQNGQKHGVHYGWWRIRDGGHLRYIENYQNDHPWGIQYHWRTDKICHIKTY
jgi:antitoxin component YwqK of YwqJK toxin-antitoxin module